MELNYQFTLLSTMQEISVVGLGPAINLIVFSILIIIAWAVQRLLGNFPDFGCKFVMSYGIMTFLDPYFILAVDCILLVCHHILIFCCQIWTPILISWTWVCTVCTDLSVRKFRIITIISVCCDKKLLQNR